MLKFRTVLGDVDGANMGFTYTHEHVYCDPYTAEKDPTLAIKNLELSIEELKKFKAAGGSTLVEGTAIDYGRDVRKLATASKESGVNLIATTGFYLYDHNPDWLKTISVNHLAELFIRETTIGIGDTDIRAGQMKCAVSLHFIHPNEEKCLRAAARAQKKTNAPIWIHHGGIMGMEILDVLESEGADLSRVVLGHMDRNPDPYEYNRIAKRGCFMSIDNLARVKRYPIQVNVDMLGDLIQSGYLEKLLISADFGRSTYLEAFGGGPGFSFILKRFVPRIQEQLHLSDDEIKTLFVHNPQRVYAWCND